jgi:hypothetical protein
MDAPLECARRFCLTSLGTLGVTGPLAVLFHQVSVMHVPGHARDIAGTGRG